MSGKERDRLKGPHPLQKRHITQGHAAQRTGPEHSLVPQFSCRKCHALPQLNCYELCAFQPSEILFRKVTVLALPCFSKLDITGVTSHRLGRGKVTSGLPVARVLTYRRVQDRVQEEDLGSLEKLLLENYNPSISPCHCGDWLSVSVSHRQQQRHLSGKRMGCAGVARVVGAKRHLDLVQNFRGNVAAVDQCLWPLSPRSWPCAPRCSEWQR